MLEQTDLKHRATGHTAWNSLSLVTAEPMAWPAAAPEGQGIPRDPHTTRMGKIQFT